MYVMDLVIFEMHVITSIWLYRRNFRVLFATHSTVCPLGLFLRGESAYSMLKPTSSIVNIMANLNYDEKASLVREKFKM